MGDKNENKICQNCKGEFKIEPEDFDFYEKIKVPSPTFCVECRRQRRFAWRNERALYKRNCDLCNKNIISLYSNNAIFPVYCRECWYGDRWDATSYARNYDFNKPFFEQFFELSKVVPRIAIFQRNAINSDFSNMVGECRNVYLSISVVLGSENIFYSWGVDKSFNILDSYGVKESDNCYENIECEKNYNCQNMLFSRNCINCHFSVDCVNCSNCIFCFNLRNKEFYIHNKQYSKEDYFNKIKEFNLGSRNARRSFIQEFEMIKRQAIYRFANIIKAVNSYGNNLLNVKNCKNCFDVHDSENIKNSYRAFYQKDSMDMDYAGKGELMYEYITGALNDYNIKFSYSAFDTVQNAEYVESCITSSNLFGCVSIKNQQNVILNKVYPKEEYLKLRERIIIQMNEMPFVGENNRIYKYGEFFPIEISPWKYNETIAQDFYPLTKEAALTKGFDWRDEEEKKPEITIPTIEIPDDIKEVKDSILNEILECVDEGKCNHQCMIAFRLTQFELQFYKKNNIPIPNKCSNCRYYERFEKVLPPKLWHRTCMCDKEGHEHRGKCQNEFETSYAPERPEIIYCEKCYQKEVY